MKDAHTHCLFRTNEKRQIAGSGGAESAESPAVHSPTVKAPKRELRKVGVQTHNRHSATHTSSFLAASARHRAAQHTTRRKESLSTHPLKKATSG